MRSYGRQRKKNWTDGKLGDWRPWRSRRLEPRKAGAIRSCSCRNFISVRQQKYRFCTSENEYKCILRGRGDGTAAALIGRSSLMARASISHLSSEQLQGDVVLLWRNIARGGASRYSRFEDEDLTTMSRLSLVEPWIGVTKCCGRTLQGIIPHVRNAMKVYTGLILLRANS
jgi:hypothetical protein